MRTQKSGVRIQNPEGFHRLSLTNAPLFVSTQLKPYLGRATKSEIVAVQLLDSDFWILDSLRFNNVESHPGVDAMEDDGDAPARFYRIRVELP
jgi:hypothetical protein